MVDHSTPASLHRSWDRCWKGVGAVDDALELMQQLIRAYEESHRKYHTTQHLFECLMLVEQYRAFAIEPDEVELALWFHDAVYQVRTSDNEQKSAKWAEQALRAAHVDAMRIERVREHILATRHAALPVGRDQELLVDIDLSILGALPARFDEYEVQVRVEYRWVPDLLFKPKRREILEEFLARDPIYATPAMRDRYEHQARENLARSLRQLDHGAR
jgi:predicted metal-dependent HD superfamily phosphohydrolase